MRIPVRHRIILAIVPVALALVSYSGALRGAREGVNDLLFSTRAVPADIVIIAIDEGSIRTIGQWPWPRAIMARAIGQLSKSKAIGIDVNYKEPSRLGLADDQILSDALRTSIVPVVLASEMQPDGSITGPISTFAAHSTTGPANVTIDPDGTVRTILLWRNGTPAFAVAIASAAAGPLMPPVSTLQRIRYAGPEHTVRSYPFTALLDGTIPPTAIMNNVVLIGATARDLQDYRQTPPGLMSGVEIQANILNNVLRNDFIRTSRTADAVLALVAGIGGVLLALLLRRIWMLVASTAAAIAVLWAGIFILFDGGFLADLLVPTFGLIIGAGAGVLARYLATTQERHFIHDTFSRYLAPQIISELLRDPSKVRLGGERRDLTILFSDIRGFSTLSETMAPTELSHFLNRYLSVMTDIVLKDQGVVDKYIGDAVMAFWGAPLDDSVHAAHGVMSALAMVDALEKFNAENKTMGQPSIDVGVGLNTGSVVVGNMGSEKRFDYTVIGDEVNLASRLESLTKTYGVNIIVSDNVLASITASGGAYHGISSREIDRVKVKGKQKPVTIHEVIPPVRAGRIGAHLELFARGLTHYYAGRWSEAIAEFDEFLTAVGTDGPAQLLIDRCRAFQEHPVVHWDGAYEMKSK